MTRRLLVRSSAEPVSIVRDATMLGRLLAASWTTAGTDERLPMVKLPPPLILPTSPLTLNKTEPLLEIVPEPVTTASNVPLAPASTVNMPLLATFALKVLEPVPDR